GADAQHRLDRHRPRHHVSRVAPRRSPCALGGLEEVADHLVEALRLPLRVSLLLDRAPIGGSPTMDLVEELRLEDPLFLFAPAAEAVDLVPERTVALGVEAIDDARCELLVR